MRYNVCSLAAVTVHDKRFSLDIRSPFTDYIIIIIIIVIITLTIQLVHSHTTIYNVIYCARILYYCSTATEMASFIYY